MNPPDGKLVNPTSVQSIHSKYYKHQLSTLATTIDSGSFSIFWPQKVLFKAKIRNFLALMLINFLVRMLQFPQNLSLCLFCS